MADESPGDKSEEELEASRELAKRIMHADVLGNARTIFEDLPEGMLETVLKRVNKWLMWTPSTPPLPLRARRLYATSGASASTYSH